MKTASPDHRGHKALRVHKDYKDLREFRAFPVRLLVLIDRSYLMIMALVQAIRNYFLIRIVITWL